MLADWKPALAYERRSDGTTAYVPGQEMSLLHEMRLMPDCEPSFLHGGGGVQPWVCPAYGVSSEVELVDWMYSFVRLLKPNVVLETGCHKGFMSWALGKAVSHNGFGQVVTCDTDPECVRITTARVEGLPVSVLLEDALSETMRPWHGNADVAFIDAAEATRGESFLRLRQGCLAVIHDTRQEPFILDGIAQVGERIEFSETWRGFTLLRKAIPCTGSTAGGCC